MGLGLHSGKHSLEVIRKNLKLPWKWDIVSSRTDITIKDLKENPERDYEWTREWSIDEKESICVELETYNSSSWHSE